VTRRLRALSERPLDPGTGRLVLLLGVAVSVGFAVLVASGLVVPGAATSSRSVPAQPPRVVLVPAAAGPSRLTGPKGRARTDGSGRATQDPQDEPGSPAARRAHRELAVPRALVGARGSKAILLVRAGSLHAARSGYRSFLREHRDDGLAYLPRFRSEGGDRGR
jgi:hypothetical protein